MFHFARTKVMQEWSPLFIFFEIISDTLRKQNVPGVPAIHHPLRHVDPGTSYVCLSGNVDHTAHWTAMYSHAKLQALVFFKRTTDFDRALRRRLRARVKDKRHPVASWNLD